MIHPGSNGGNLHLCTNNGELGSGLQDQGLHSTSQEPGLSSHPQRHVSARPVFYVHAPPPPPFLHYQWPMPLFYNPFEGFPGMGSGVVMPPFPPHPYMEAPAYIMPQPHIQHVDYRRMFPPQVPGPSAPFQNPNQSRRFRPPYSVPVRETVNSEVQTEPTQRGDDSDRSSCVRSDSGHGTASNSPSSGSSSHKPDSAEVDNFEDLSRQVRILHGNSADLQVNGTCEDCTVNSRFNILRPTGTMVESSLRATQEAQKIHKDSVVQEKASPCRNGHCNMWSVSSTDSMVPVCSSSQREDEVLKEKLISNSNNRCGSGTPQVTVLKMADKPLPQKSQLLLHEDQLEHETSADQSPERQTDLVVVKLPDNNGEGPKDGENFCKILKLPLALHELLSDLREDDFPETFQCPRSSNSCHMKKKLDDSIWSVESLPTFIPTKEWLLQNGILEPEVIVEMMEETENCRHSPQNDNLIVNASKDDSQASTLSLGDSAAMSESLLIFSTIAEKLSPPVKSLIGEMDATEMIDGANKGQILSPGKDPIALKCLQNKSVSTSNEKEVDDDRSSEPEAQSPNQESLAFKEKSSCSPKNEATLLKSIIVEKMEKEDGQCEQLCVPVAYLKMAEVSPSRGHLVDCGIQCNKLEFKCLCEDIRCNMALNRKHPFKVSETKKTNGGSTEDFHLRAHMQKNQKRPGQWRNRASEKHNSQQEAYAGNYGKPGKSKGGNGRNHRY